MLAHLASLFLLAFAVSLDGFGVGVTYGLRRIRIPVISIAIISLCSGIIVWLAMQVGTWLTQFMPPDAGAWIGAVLLILIGIWALFQYWRGKRQQPEDQEESSDAAVKNAMQKQDYELVHEHNRRIEPGQKDQFDHEKRTQLKGLEAAEKEDVTPVVSFSFELRFLGLVIQILRRPQIADVDRSGIITASEALLLGVALSLDSFGAGLGAAMVGFSPLPTALLISVSSGLFLLGGMQLGFRFSAFRVMQALSILPGLMLITMGILKLF